MACERTCTKVGMPPCIDHVCCVVWPVSSSWCGSGRCTTSTTDPMLQVDPPTLSPCAHPCAGPHVSTRSYSMLGWTRCYGSCFGKTCVLHKRTSWKRKCTSWEYDVVLPGWGVHCLNLQCPGPLVLEAGGLGQPRLASQHVSRVTNVETREVPSGDGTG